MNEPELHRNGPVAILAFKARRAWVGWRHAVVPLHDVALTAVSLRNIHARRVHLLRGHRRRRNARAKSHRICVVLVVVMMHYHLLDNGRHRAAVLVVRFPVIIRRSTLASCHKDGATNDAKDTTDDDRGGRAQIRGLRIRVVAVICGGRIIVTSASDVHIRARATIIAGGSVRRAVRGWSVGRRATPVSGG